MNQSWLEKYLAPLFMLIVLGFGITLIKNPQPIQSKDYEVDFLNVGQGDATLLKLGGNKEVLIDGGPDKSILTELGRNMPVMDKEIEAIVLTHPHADHLSGLNYVLSSYKVDQIYLTGTVNNSPDFEEFVRLVKEKNVPVQKFYGGKEILIDDLRLDAFWPAEDLSGQKSADLNEDSLIFTAVYQGSKILFLSDSKKETSEKLAEEGKFGMVDLVKISHHGSKTGTSEKLINLTKPKYAVILVGKNSFGHPAPSVLSMLSAVRVFRTDQNGMTKLIYQNGGLVPN